MGRASERGIYGVCAKVTGRSSGWTGGALLPLVCSLCLTCGFGFGFGFGFGLLALLGFLRFGIPGMVCLGRLGRKSTRVRERGQGGRVGSDRIGYADIRSKHPSMIVHPFRRCCEYSYAPRAYMSDTCTRSLKRRRGIGSGEPCV
jgi:hypothetical protein